MSQNINKWKRKRKFNALREYFGKEDSEIRNQQFRIKVRNVRGIKCRKLGLINTDKECQLYNQVMSTHPAKTSLRSSSTKVENWTCNGKERFEFSAINENASIR